MTNAERFKQTFGLYATELWAKPEKEFLEWLNADHFRDDTKKITEEVLPMSPILMSGTLKLDWIPSAWKPYNDEDDIPEGKYLVQTVDGEMHTGYMSSFGWMFGQYVPRVVAYRPLPEKYKGDVPCQS